VGALAAADIVSIWELGRHRPDWSKALIALGPALPEARPSELAEMTVGERNAHLLALRGAVIGPVMHAMVKCPICGEPLEFEQRVDELLDGYAPPAPREFAFASGDYAARYRLLNSGDLAHAAACDAEPDAREALAGRALLELSRAGEAIAAADLPAEIGDALARDMADRDPLAHLAIPLACVACEHVWSATLQIVPFLWIELERKAKQVLEEVVVLARAYGWSEAAILEMGPGRRQYYLDSIG
jgi:hypothetical protein